jgi:hypothetical protein
MIISRLNNHRTINLSGILVEKIKTHIIWLVTFFRKSCHLWEKLEQFRIDSEDTNINIMRRRKDSICMPNKSGNNTDTHTECVILTAFPLWQYLGESASTLRTLSVSLSQRCRWDVRFFEVLPHVNGCLVFEIWGERICPKFKRRISTIKSSGKCLKRTATSRVHILAEYP